MPGDWPIERPADWVQFVNEPQSEAELAALRRCVNRGRPFGDDAWRDAVVAEPGLEPTLREPGRPRKPTMELNG